MNEKIPVFGVIGRSDSGKTGLVCKLVEELQALGYDVATIKHTRGDFTIDSEDKDTWRHAEAGAGLVIFSTPDETDFLFRRHLSLEDMLSHVETFGDYDLVLVEGMKDESIPKISVDESFEEDSFVHYREDIAPVIEEIEREIEIQEILAHLAGLDCGACGYPDCRSLASAILEDEMEVEDCPKIESGSRVTLCIDGEEIPLGDFPSEFIEKTLRGMLNSLKGIEGDEKKIEIEIDESDR